MIHGAKRQFFVFTLVCLLTACGNDLTTIVSDIDSDTEIAENTTNTNSGTDDSGVILQYTDDEDDYLWNESDVVDITFNGTSITIDSTGASIDGSIVTIHSNGTYRITGTLTDGQVIVDLDVPNCIVEKSGNTASEDIVQIILNGVNIHCSTNAALYVKNSNKTIIILETGTENYLSDGTTYVDEDDANAAFYSKDYLSIYGDGTLTVTGNYNDGITGKDELLIKSGIINVSAVDDGIRGKDYLAIENGNINVNSGGDGLKSDNEDDADLGYIIIENGSFNITSGGDGITAETYVTINNGNFTIECAGGSGVTISDDLSAKGIKAGVGLTIEDGDFDIDAADDGVHANTSMVINGGTFTVATGDDGFHTDVTLEINNGDITVVKSYEGVESASLTINGGYIDVTSSDDGINAAGETNNYLYINGGYIAVNADGDGIDANGYITMTAGTVVVNGPTRDDNGAIDYDGTFNISGGFLAAAGSSRMAQAPSTSSSQRSVLITFASKYVAGNIFHIRTSSGEEVLTFAPVKQYQAVIFSSDALVTGTTYEVYSGGSSTGTITNGLYSEGTYTAGTKLTSFTVSNIVTNISIR